MAAVLAVARNRSFADLDIKELCAELRAQGAIVDRS
jgi:hypothetical protein